MKYVIKNNTDRDMPDHYVTIWRMWPEEAGNSSESRSIKARSTGGRKFWIMGRLWLIYRMWLKAM